MDIEEYTDEEIRKNLALLETHLKQAPFYDELFCEECINKHALILNGLAEEGLTACVDCDTEKYAGLIKFLEEIKDRDYQKEGVEFAKQARRIRKKFVPCTGENMGLKDKDDVKEKRNELIKDLHAAKDKISQDRISYGIYLCEWFLRGRRCSDG